MLDLNKTENTKKNDTSDIRDVLTTDSQYRVAIAKVLRFLILLIYANKVNSKQQIKSGCTPVHPPSTGVKGLSVECGPADI